MPTFKLNINNKEHQVDVESNTPLLWVLRDELELVGTKYGCGIGQCGACTIHFNGMAMRSCVLPVSSIGETKITTIEGLSENNDHPVQKAWKEVDVPQCGYCQAGQIMTAAAYLERKKEPSKTEIRRAMQGNICRCGAYNRIEKAVCEASKEMNK